MKRLSILAMLLFGFLGNSQGDETVQPDNKYLEDQFYMGLGFNFMLDKPMGVDQTSLSYNLQAGFIKDIPLNSRRNFGIGLGFGYAANSYYSNIIAQEVNNIITYQVGGVEGFRRSKFETHAVEMPFEIRWRTSTASDYKFWRIYTGFKAGYVFAGRSKLVTETDSSGFSNGDIQEFQYGLTLSFGYNTWNVQAYYGLNKLLDEASMLDTGETIDVKVLRIGVIFYIL